jgi:hypothetical protein
MNCRCTHKLLGCVSGGLACIEDQPRAHIELHFARLTDGLRPHDVDKYVRDAQRVIESIEALVRIHNAQEEDIYEQAAGIL